MRYKHTFRSDIVKSLANRFSLNDTVSFEVDMKRLTKSEVITFTLAISSEFVINQPKSVKLQQQTVTKQSNYEVKMSNRRLLDIDRYME